MTLEFSDWIVFPIVLWIESSPVLIEIHVANNSGAVSFGRGAPGGATGQATMAPK